MLRPRSVLLVLISVACSTPCLAADAAYWRFEEGAPPAVDSSGYGNTGTVTGATYSSLVPWFGRPNSWSLLFDDAADQVEIAAGPASNLDTFPSGMTVEAIIRPEQLPIPPDTAGQRLSYILWADDGTYELLLLSDASGRTTLRGGVNAVGGATGPCTVSVSSAFVDAVSFSHVAMTYASELLELYIDGKLVDQGTAPGGCGSSVGPVGFRDIVRIGNDETAVGFPFNDRAWKGWIDEVRISDVALDPGQFLRPGPDKLHVTVWSSDYLERWDLDTEAIDYSVTLPVSSDPRSMAVGPDGDLFIAYQTDNDVKRHDRYTGFVVGTFAASSELDAPIGLTFGPDDHLYVNTQTPDGVLRYDGTTGAFIDTFITGLSHNASALRFGPDGHLYVLQDVEVLRFDGQTGALIGTFTSGAPAADFAGGFIFGPDGNLYVTMSVPVGFGNEGRVSRFDGATGAYIDEFVAQASGGLELGIGIEFGPEGDLYIADFRSQSTLRYDGQTGAFDSVFAVNGGQIHDLHFVPEPARWQALLAGISLLAALGRPFRSHDSSSVPTSN